MNTAILFDLDGTLLDTLGDLHVATNHVLTRFGYPSRTIQEVCRFVGNGAGLLIRRAIPEGEAVEPVLAAFQEYYAAHCNILTRPYDGIIEVIATLRKAGYLTAVVSNKADFAVQDLCKIWFDGLFDVAVGEREGLLRKPAPDSVFEVCRLLGVSVEESVYIGDSEVDYQTACNAKMDVISVEWGFRDAAFLKEIGAKKIISTPSELAECFGISL